jgi:DMSO/TMAO reductase YedYZ heme-binding membrane subunit
MKLLRFLKKLLDLFLEQLAGPILASALIILTGFVLSYSIGWVATQLGMEPVNASEVLDGIPELGFLLIILAIVTCAIANAIWRVFRWFAEIWKDS